MNLDEIRSCKKAFLRLEDVCGAVIPCSDRTLRRILRTDQASVHIPIVKIGSRFFIPRKLFLDYLDGNQGQKSD